MINNRRDHRFAVDLEHLKSIASTGRPQIFHHPDLLETLQNAPVINQKKLLNTLDHIHFTNRTVMVHARDPQYSEEFLLRAHIEFCGTEEVSCLWDESLATLPEGLNILNMIVSDDLSLVLLPLQGIRQNGEGFGFIATLPEKGHLLGKRHVRRHSCSGIHVHLTQSGFTARGELIDFSPIGFRVHLRSDAKNSFVWLNTDKHCIVHLLENERILFSGLCRCIRHAGDLLEKILVLVPIESLIQRIPKSKHRTPRLQVTPPLCAHFKHPFFGKPIQRDICNLTFTGFAVESQYEDSVLMPGMIIPDLEIRYAGALKMICDAQVIYQRKIGKSGVRNGLAILDMNFRSYRQLSHIMVHAGEPHAHFSNELELENLWEFLFDTGFIYPRKYAFLQPCREEFKTTYRKLYREDQDIEAHFTYQKNGRIYGHVSIFRAYQRSWMVHHLAARPLNGKRTGLSVLRNVLRFFNGLYRYPSIGMDYMLFYFRPENRFPNLFFGGFARDLGNPRACSLDLFAYMHHQIQIRDVQTTLPAGWQLVAYTSAHIPELERFYRNRSGGLMLEALPFTGRNDGEEPLDEIYGRMGLFRRWSIHSLTFEGSLKAVFMVNRSDVGLNLSDLLNGVKIIVIDPAGLDWKVMTDALSGMTSGYTTNTIPLLIYPESYPREQGIKIDKQYLLWILDSQYGKEYLNHMENQTRMTFKFLARYLLNKLMRK